MFNKAGLSLGAVALAAMMLVPASASAKIEDIELINGDPWGRTIWVTMKPTDQNGEVITGRQAPQYTLCLKPREKRKYALQLKDFSSAFVVRGEVTRNADCQQPVDCDTTHKVQVAKPGSRQFVFDADRQKCWWREHVQVN